MKERKTKMKINFDKKTVGTCIEKLTVGSTFFSKRTGTDEIGLYMVIDKSSGLFLDKHQGKVMAVNLATGQIRTFKASQKVEPIKAEVILPK
jgi:hypothetical protein